MRIGYIRISKHEQNEALQRDALKEAGCEKYFSDTMTGVKFERRGLEKALAFIRSETVLECEAVMLHGQNSKIGEVFAQV
jgi:DNA invertase Pin-like site-specific DNA recombinase